MAIIFKNVPTTADGEATNYTIDTVKKFCVEAGLPEKSLVEVGFNETRIKHKLGVTTLNIGVSDVKNQSPKITEAMRSIRRLFVGDQTYAPSAHSSVPVTDNHTDLTEDEWVIQMTEDYFPDTASLCNANKMYQPVHGTGSKTIYRTVFFGDNLRGASRISGSKISFRFTTTDDKKPQGQVLNILKRLGLDTEYDDRITGHSEVAGNYATRPEEFRMVFGAFYGALRPFLTSPHPALIKLTEGVK